jgi:cation transport protein ChaC
MWIFGYGSLMWDNWAEPYDAARVDGAVLRGYRRSFNKASIMNWGSRTHPAPTLGLEPDTGANCIGTAFEISDDRSHDVLSVLRTREGRSFSLEKLVVQLPDNREVHAHVPINTRTGPTYLGSLLIADRATMARIARGSSGTCVDYVRNLAAKLAELGIDDCDVTEFLEHVVQESRPPRT